MNEVTKQLNSVEYVVQHHDGDELQLKGYKAIKSFFDKELKFWQVVENPKGQVDGFIRRLAQAVAAIDTLEAQTKRDVAQFPTHKQTMIAQIDANLSKARPRNQIIYSSKPEASFLKELHAASPEQADAAIAYFLKQTPTISNRNQLIGTLKAYEFDRQSESFIVKKSKDEKRTLGKLRSEWDETRTTLITEHSDFVETQEQWRKEFEEKVNSWQVEKEAGVEKLESLYGEKLHLEAPVQYWENRATKYASSAQNWLWVTIGIVAVSIIILLAVLYEMPEAFTRSLFKGDPMAIRGIIIFASIISFAAYLIHIVVKIMLSNYHLVRDSEERAQLTHVYLALIKNESIDKEDRQIVLQALFSRAETGLLKDDGSPTMPNYFSGLINAIGRKP
jgi:hypothetical protein